MHVGTKLSQIIQYQDIVLILSSVERLITKIPKVAINPGFFERVVL